MVGELRLLHRVLDGPFLCCLSSLMVIAMEIFQYRRGSGKGRGAAENSEEKNARVSMKNGYLSLVVLTSVDP